MLRRAVTSRGRAPHASIAARARPPAARVARSGDRFMLSSRFHGRRAMSSSSGEQFVLSVPEMGDSITEGDLQELIKAVGDPVAVDEIVAVVETDKVNVEVRSPVAGIVKELSAAEGDSVEVGTPLMVFALGEGQAVPTPPETPAASESTPPSTPNPPEPVPTAAKPAPVEVKGDTKTTGRVPSIRFRHGKRDIIDRDLDLPAQDPAVGAATQAQRVVYEEYEGIPARFERRPLSEEAMLLIEMGGAEPY